jgi:hypothetical protein
MPHDPTAEQVIEEWAAMVERLYGTATPTGSTDPAMSAPPTKPQQTCCRPRRPPPHAPSMVRVVPLRGMEGVTSLAPQREVESRQLRGHRDSRLNLSPEDAPIGTADVPGHH